MRSAEMLVWMGDFNYRVEMEYNDAVRAVGLLAAGNRDALPAMLKKVSPALTVRWTKHLTWGKNTLTLPCCVPKLCGAWVAVGLVVAAHSTESHRIKLIINKSKKRSSETQTYNQKLTICHCKSQIEWKGCMAQQQLLPVKVEWLLPVEVERSGPPLYWYLFDHHLTSGNDR